MKLQLLAATLIAMACLSASAQDKGNGDIGSHDGTNQGTNTDINGRVNINTGKLRARFIVAGTGNHVCSAENSFKNVPVLGRGESLREAQIVAQQECARQSGDAFFCKVTSCEKDKANGSISVIFDVIRESTSINIGFKGKSKFLCTARGWNSDYVAKAPTRTEALALVKTTCAEDEGIRTNTEPNGFFCRTDIRDCEQLSGVGGNVDIGGLIGGIFKKKK